MENQLDAAMLRRGLSFADAITPLIDAIRQMAEAFKSIGHFRLPDIQSSKWYALAGRPYGNNTRGKKRWLREMKH